MNLKNIKLPPGTNSIKIAVHKPATLYSPIFDTDVVEDVKIITLYKDSDGNWVSDDEGAELLDTAIRTSGTLGAEIDAPWVPPKSYYSPDSVTLRLKIDMESLWKQRDEFCKQGRFPETVIIELDKVGFTLYGLPVEFRMKE
jgi:hypothetical protein